ncbi:DNA polymerase I, thermostable-like [Cryptotermes secundus]|uniref:DNA polymerase I, thermostable-like n=1 Tax=Cryptotermes secundus TaxID=105785 RepID=UPI001454CF82|nr:DNA polymerase I, thermostable-like [Cryptotermes secundus]
MVLVQSQLRNMGYTSLNPVASLALHLHDELLYEVCREGAKEVAQRIQTALENAVSLAVRLPVKMKIGDTWGSLQEITL